MLLLYSTRNKYELLGGKNSTHFLTLTSTLLSNCTNHTENIVSEFFLIFIDHSFLFNWSKPLYLSSSLPSQSPSPSSSPPLLLKTAVLRTKTFAKIKIKRLLCFFFFFFFFSFFNSNLFNFLICEFYWICMVLFACCCRFSRRAGLFSFIVYRNLYIVNYFCHEFIDVLLA